MTLGLRRLAASTLTLAAGGPAAYLTATDGGNTPIVAWLALGGLPIAAALVFVRRLETQILVRAVMWGVLVVGTLVSVIADSSSDQADALSLAMVLGAGLALLALGATGLDEPPARAAFVPVAYRGVLIAIMVMAIADTGALLFWGGLVTESHLEEPLLSLFLFGGAGMMTIALAGLYGLRVWGFALNVLANLMIASVAWFVPHLPNEIAACFTATAIGQLFIGAPLLRGLATRSDSFLLSPRMGRILGVALIAGVMALAVGARIYHNHWGLLDCMG